MPIKQVNFEIPPEIEKKLNSGEFKRIGGIIRNTEGQIVVHLKEIEPISGKESSREHLLGKVKAHPVVTGCIIGFTIVTGFSFYLWKSLKSKKRKEFEKEALSVMNNFNKAWAYYCYALQNATLDKNEISILYSSLNQFDVFNSKWNFSLELEPNALMWLDSVITGYTAVLEDVNDINDYRSEKISAMPADGAIKQIMDSLERQTDLLQR